MSSPRIDLGSEELGSALWSEIVVEQKLNDHWSCRIVLRDTPDRRPGVEDHSGQPLRVTTVSLDGEETVLFSGFVRGMQLLHETAGAYGAVLEAVSLCWQLAQSPRRAYYKQQTAHAAATRVLASSGLVVAGAMPAGATLSYVQWGETNFQFFARLVDDGEAWFRPAVDGSAALEVQTAFQPGPTVEWRQGEQGLLSWTTRGRLQPTAAEGAHYDYQPMRSAVASGVTSEPAWFPSAAGRMVDAVRAAAPQLGSAWVDRHRAATGEDHTARLERESRRALASAVTCSGVSGEPRVRAGDAITVAGLPGTNATYGVTEVKHSWTSEGYQNRFIATPASRWSPAERPARPELDGLHPARVVANHDPHNQGRIRVSYYWQEGGETSWVRLLSPHAGPGRGMMFLPEVGDEVLICFEEGDPERPYAVGSAWNGAHPPPSAGFHAPGEQNGAEFATNNVKRIVTKSGHRITMVDTPGKETIAFATPQHNKLMLTEHHADTGRPAIVLATTGDMILSAPNGRIHSRSATHSREVGVPEVPQAVPAVFHPASSAAAAVTPVAYPDPGTPSIGTGEIPPTERAILCETICECNTSAPVSASGANLKQLCVSGKLRALDAATGYRSTIKSEVSYDMTQSPPAPIMTNGNPTRPHPVERYPSQKIPDFSPGQDMMKRPDAIVVKNPALPPTQDNIQSVVEIKFPPDKLNRDQLQNYSFIHGGVEPQVLSPQQCGCAEQEKERVPLPVPVPVPAPQTEDHTVRNALLVGAAAAVAIAALPEEAVAAAAYGVFRLGSLILALT